MVENKSSIQDLEDYKKLLEEVLFEHKKLQNICTEMNDTINMENVEGYYFQIKDYLRYYYKNIDGHFKFLYKKITNKNFATNCVFFLSAIKDFAILRQCATEEDIERIEEKLLSIGNEIFAEILKPEENPIYQKQKKNKEQKRQDIYKKIEDKYNIKNNKDLEL